MASLSSVIFGKFTSRWSWLKMQQAKTDEQVEEVLTYDLLLAYYLNNGLYDILNRMFGAEGFESNDIKPLRNPAYRVVEFYASKLWPGTLPNAMPIITANESIVSPIHMVWKWSNWGAQKQKAARWFSMYGDMFIKVVQGIDPASEEVNRVYFQLIEPRFVTDFSVDERGYLQFIRIDIPQIDLDYNKLGEVVHAESMHTEVWTKQAMKRWKHNRRADASLGSLGQPSAVIPLSDFGIDFIPIVWQPFKQIDNGRGIGAFTLQLDKIDEANRQATRLNQMMFRYNKALWALRANAMDSSGRPLPPPRLPDNADTLDMEDDTLLRLPGVSEIDSLVPNINYGAMLATLQDHMMELEKDLPELAYYRLRDMGQISGVAARTMLSDAEDRLAEARTNAETALIRANQMALTIGSNSALFNDIGNYESGDFEHTIGARPFIQLQLTEIWEVISKATAAGVPLVTILKRQGWTDDEIQVMLEEIEQQNIRQQSSLATALLNAQRDFDSGAASNGLEQP